MTIMIVDDNKSVRDTIRTLLQPSAEMFCECTDGDEALEAYGRVHPDWVLMDIRMKRMDGFDATREILKRYPDARIIMVSQYDDPKLHEKARRLGALESILKDNLAEIDTIIRRGH